MLCLHFKRGNFGGKTLKTMRMKPNRRKKKNGVKKKSMIVQPEATRKLDSARNSTSVSVFHPAFTTLTPRLDHSHFGFQNQVMKSWTKHLESLGISIHRPSFGRVGCLDHGSENQKSSEQRPRTNCLERR